MNEGNSRGVNVDLNMLNKPGTFLSAHALALYNWLKSPQGLDDSGEWQSRLEMGVLTVSSATRRAVERFGPPGRAVQLQHDSSTTLSTTADLL